MPSTKSNCSVPGRMLILMSVTLMVVTAGCGKQQSKSEPKLQPGPAEIKKKLAAPPEIDTMPVSVRDLKDAEKAILYSTVEKRIQAQFPNSEWFRAPDQLVSPGWAMYSIKSDDDQTMLQIFFGGSTKEAAHTIRELDLLISFRQGFEPIPGIGDEAYAYGPTGSLFARYANIVVNVGSRGSDRRDEAAKLVFEAVDEIVKADDAP